MTTDTQRRSLIRRLIDAARSPAQEPTKKAPQRIQRAGLSFGDILLASSRFTSVNTLEDSDTDRAYRLAMTTAWAYSDIDLISTRLASAEFEIKRRVKKGKKGEDSELEDVKAHPAQALLRQPNTLMPGSLLIDTVTVWFLLRGNGYIFVSSQGPGHGSPVELWPLEASKVFPRPDTAHMGRGVFAGKLIIDYDVSVNGIIQTLPGENIIHWRTTNPWDYWEGLSPLVALNTTLNSDFFQATWLSSFYGEDNAVPSSIISLPPEITDDIFEESAKLIRSEFAAKRRTAITRAGDMKVEVIEQSIKDMELIGSREFNRKIIDRVFGVPEGLTSGSLSGDSRLAAEITFARNTIQPMLNNLASAMTARLAYFYEDENLVVAAPDVVPQDRAMDLQEFSAHKTVMTVNEARKELGLEDHEHELAKIPIELLPIIAEQWKSENVKQPDPYGSMGPGSGPSNLFPGDDEGPGDGPGGNYPGEDQGPDRGGNGNYPGEDQGPPLDQGRQYPWNEEDPVTGKRQKGQADTFGSQNARSQVRNMTGKSADSAATMAAIEDLKRWRKVAMGEVKAGRRPEERPFASDYIPESLHADTASLLALAADEGGVKAIFDRAIEGLETDSHTPYRRGEVKFAVEIDDEFIPVLEAMNRQFAEIKSIVASDDWSLSWAESGKVDATSAESVAARLAATKHGGPGPHEGTGTDQTAHGEGVEAWLKENTGGHVVLWNLPYGGRESATSSDKTVRAAWGRASAGAPIERLYEMFEMAGNGYRSKVDAFDTPNGDYALGVYGHLEDAKGTKIAEYHWILQPDTVFLEHIVFDKATQGTGVGGSFTEALEDAFSRMGAKSVEMVANYDVGGYAWARMGYDFARTEPGSEEYVYNEKSITAIKEKIGEDIRRARNIGIQDWPKHPAAQLLDKCQHSWEYATFTWDGFNFGKGAMLGRKWHAEKVIGGEGDRIGALYNTAKRQFGKKIETAQSVGKAADVKVSARPGWMTVRVGDGYGDAAMWDDIDGPVDDAWQAAVLGVSAESSDQSLVQ